MTKHQSTSTRILKTVWMCVLLFLCGIKNDGAQRIELVGTIDGTDQIFIGQDSATWLHQFGDLAATSVLINGVLWQPAVTGTLANSGSTTYLSNTVDFLNARVVLSEGQDTLVMQREQYGIFINVADTPPGVGGYHLIVEFPESPTLRVVADIDGSDELHISYAGARWIHKHWGLPAGVSLNGVSWDVGANDFLTNNGATAFLAAPAHFENATLASSSGRGLLTMRKSGEGVILNFADNEVGSDRFEALIAFPPQIESNNASIAVVSSATLTTVTASGISIGTVRGVWYELQVASTLSPADWAETGAFVRGNGAVMTLFDPAQTQQARFYRIVSRAGLQ